MDPFKSNSKKIVKINSGQWEKMKIEDMQIDTNLVTCQKRLFPNSKDKKLLYIGFGEGQNLVHLAKEGFKMYGTEIAESRIKETQKKLKKEKLKADLRLVDSNILPFEDNFFDIVIGWQSLYYNDAETLKKVLNEVLRVLRRGGGFLSSMVSTKQVLLCGKEIAPNVFRPIKESQKKCVVFCFKNKREIKNMYSKKFSDIKIGFYSSELFGSPNFHYAIYCTKRINGKK